MASDKLDHFNPGRVRLLTTIVDGLGPLLESARLNEDLLNSNSQLSEALDTLNATQTNLLQRSEELEALVKISSILGQPGAYEDKLSAVTQEITRVAEAQGVRISVPDRQEGGLRTVAPRSSRGRRA